MTIYSNINIKKYEIEKLCRIFLPFESFSFVENDGENNDISIIGNGGKLKASVKLGGKTVTLCDSDEFFDEKETQLKTAVLVYNCFVKITGYSSPWGILTGIRPARLYSQTAEKLGEAAADELFLNSFSVSPEKLSLCKAALGGEREIISLSEEKSFSLYVGIPFCPSRCSYCSFVSHSIEQAQKLIPEYVRLLCREIEETGKIAKRLSLKLETVYIGGGTPTTLTAQQLAEVMAAINRSFDMSTCREYTVEAGRPDTITADKLLSIKQGGATRISVNPQTMNDAVLKAIGRRHSAEQTVKAFELARKLDFDNINMDLIAGLPDDTPKSFESSIRTLLSLNPESITVHTLCLKRSAKLSSGDYAAVLARGSEAAEMLKTGSALLEKSEFLPYYMYRQSKMVGNLENVGYAKKGYEGLYNVYIMDETHTILACGGSAVTKLRKYGENVIERIYNFKYPYEYISKFDEQLERKRRILSFYGE